MKKLAKVQAGGIVRTSLDNTWRTPPKIKAAAAVYFGGTIPFDPATGLENPMDATRFCAGLLDWAPEDATKKERRQAADRPRRLFRGLGLGLELSQGSKCVGLAEGLRPFTLAAGRGLVMRTQAAVSAERMPFCSGLSVAWDWPTWVNPPYGRELKRWLAKVVEEAARGTEIVGLVPCSRWEQGYFQRAWRAARAHCLIRSRVAFISSIDYVPVAGNPYASMLLGWNTDPGRWLEAFGPLGACQTMRPMRRRASRARPEPALEPEAMALFEGVEAIRVPRIGTAAERALEDARAALAPRPIYVPLEGTLTFELSDLREKKSEGGR